MRLIDADELLEHKFKSASERTDLSVEYMGGWNDAIDSINENAPTIEAEPIRHGKWVRILDTRFGEKLNDIIGCSVCNIYFSSMDMIRRSYCPNCGARMDAEND